MFVSCSLGSKLSSNMEPRSPGGESFGTNLLRSVPKITARHEEEMKLLESLHQHMNKRTKADMDYAAQLAKINAAAVRACPKDTQDEISSIIQVCENIGCFLGEG